MNISSLLTTYISGKHTFALLTQKVSDHCDVYKYSLCIMLLIRKSTRCQYKFMKKLMPRFLTKSFAVFIYFSNVISRVEH